jgi:hypothetical protein
MDKDNKATITGQAMWGIPLGNIEDQFNCSSYRQQFGDQVQQVALTAGQLAAGQADLRACQWLCGMLATVVSTVEDILQSKGMSLSQAADPDGAHHTPPPPHLSKTKNK